MENYREVVVIHDVRINLYKGHTPPPRLRAEVASRSGPHGDRVDFLKAYNLCLAMEFRNR